MYKKLDKAFLNSLSNDSDTNNHITITIILSGKYLK